MSFTAELSNIIEILSKIDSAIHRFSIMQSSSTTQTNSSSHLYNTNSRAESQSSYKSLSLLSPHLVPYLERRNYISDRLFDSNSRTQSQFSHKSLSFHFPHSVPYLECRKYISNERFQWRRWYRARFLLQLPSRFLCGMHCDKSQ